MLDTKLAADMPRVLADRVQLQQVLINLITNAAEAMSEVSDRPRYYNVRLLQHPYSRWSARERAGD